MKTLRELTITGGRDEIERFLVRLLAAVGEDWERDIASEARLAGSVSGKVFEDRNGNGSLDTSEPALAGVTVYADLDNSGTFDVGEPSAVTTAPR